MLRGGNSKLTETGFDITNTEYAPSVWFESDEERDNEVFYKSIFYKSFSNI